MSARPWSGWSVLLHREMEKLALGRAAERTRNSAVQETNDRLEHPVRRMGVASMNAEDTPVEAEHHRTIGVGDDSLDLPQAEHGQAISEQQVQFLTRFPAFPLTRLAHSP